MSSTRRPEGKSTEVHRQPPQNDVPSEDRGSVRDSRKKTSVKVEFVLGVYIPTHKDWYYHPL